MLCVKNFKSSFVTNPQVREKIALKLFKIYSQLNENKNTAYLNMQVKLLSNGIVLSLEIDILKKEIRSQSVSYPSKTLWKQNWQIKPKERKRCIQCIQII